MDITQELPKIEKLRSGVRVLWGLHQQMQMRLRDQQESVTAGNELLESLSELLSEGQQDGSSESYSNMS